LSSILRPIYTPSLIAVSSPSPLLISAIIHRSIHSSVYELLKLINR
jgi:hypothetical protein